MAQTAQQRRRAQQQVARKLKKGERILPEKITAKTRKVAGRRKDLINQIDKFKKDHYSHRPKWSEKGARYSARINPQTGEPWTLDELEKIWKMLQSATDDDIDLWQWDDIFEAEEKDYTSALYYH